MKISVIILSFNSEQNLPDLFSALAKTRWPDGSHEVIFIDNNSSDKSRDFLKSIEGRDNYRVVYNEKNLGFAGGNNLGINLALETGADYIVLLNDDTVPEPGWLLELVRVAESDRTIGCVQSLLMYHDMTDIINSWGNQVHFLGFAYAGGNLKKLPEGFKAGRPREVTYCSGAAALYRSAALQKVGILDPLLESYHEDADIGLRLRLDGFKSYLAPKSVVYHKYSFLGSRSHAKGSNYKYYLMERNRLYLMIKYYTVKTWLLIFPAWLIMETGVLAFAIWRGFWRKKIRGYWWIIFNLDKILEQRRTLREKLGNNNKLLMQDFVASIDYQEIGNPWLRYLVNPFMKVYWRLIKHFL